MADALSPDFLQQLLNLSGSGNGDQPTQWGQDPYTGAGDSSGRFNPNGGGGNKPDILGLLSMFGGGSANKSPAGGWLGNASTAIQGISQLGGLYLGIKQLGLAKDQFKLSKEAYKTNLANQTASYNTQVGDRIAGRNYATEEERQAALKAAQLPVGG